MEQLPSCCNLYVRVTTGVDDMSLIISRLFQRAALRLHSKSNDGDRSEFDGFGGGVGRRSTHFARWLSHESRQAPRLHGADSGRGEGPLQVRRLTVVFATTDFSCVLAPFRRPVKNLWKS